MFSNSTAMHLWCVFAAATPALVIFHVVFNILENIT